MLYAGKRSSMVFISSLCIAYVTIPTNIPGDSHHINHWKGKTRLIPKQRWSSEQVYTDLSLQQCPWTIFPIFLQDILYSLDLPGNAAPWFKSSAKYLSWLAKTGKHYWLQLKHNPLKLCNRPQEMLSCSFLKDGSVQTAPLSSKNICKRPMPPWGTIFPRLFWQSRNLTFPMPITFPIAQSGTGIALCHVITLPLGSQTWPWYAEIIHKAIFQHRKNFFSNQIWVSCSPKYNASTPWKL